MVDSRLAFDIMARDDGATAVLAKVERALDKTGNAAKKNTAISADAAKASANLTKAHNAESDALDKVQVAEARLSDVRNNSKAKTGQVVAAEKMLAKARRDAAVAGDTAQKAAKDLGKILDNEGKSAGKGAAKSVLHWFTGAGKDFEKAGKTAGDGFNSGIMGALKTPVVGPAIIGGLVVAVAAAAVPLGAVVAGAIVTGAGAGLSAIGLKFAAESEAVKSIWSKTAADLGAQMRTISKPFESTLVAMSVVARRTFAGLKPQLAAAFKTLAPAVSGFGDQLGRSLQKLGPALQPLAGAFSKVLGALGPAMNDLFAKLSASLTKLSESISKNPTALADFTRGVGGLASDLIGFVARLNDADAAFKRLTGISAVTALMYTLRGAVATVTGPIDLLAKGFTAVADATKWAIDRQFPGQAKAAADAATAEASSLAKAAAAHLAHANAVAHSAHATHEANAAAALLAGTYDRQVAATDKLIGSLNKLSSLLLTLSGAQIGYQQAVDDATQAIKDNGKTHDINTQKGRDNKTALDQVAASAIAQRDAMLKANDGNTSAAKSALSSRAAYEKLAQQMGFSIPVAKAMAAQLIALPPVKRVDVTANIKDLQGKLATAQAALKSPHLTATKKATLKAEISNLKAGIASSKGLLASLPLSKTARLLADKANLDAKLAAAKKQLADPKLSATKRAKLEATYAQLTAAVAAAQAKINSLHGKTVTNSVITKYSSTGVNLQAPSSVGRRASGGPVAKGVPYVVGEHRPELFVPKESGTILPKVPSMAVGQSVASGMAQGMLGGGGSAVAAAGQVAAQMIAKAKDVLGIASPSKAFAQLGLYINQGFKIGLLGSAKQVQSVMASLMSKVLNIAYNAADTKKAAQKQVATYTAQVAAATSRAGKRAAQARLNQAKVDLSNVQAIASRLGTSPKRNAVLAMIQRENVAMQKLANQRAVIAGRLKAAQAKLASAIQVRDDFKKAVVDAALSFNAITNLQPDQGGQLVAGDIIARMQQTLGATKNFAANLASLKAQGLRSDLYKQIADAGVEAGGATAAALLMGGKGAVAQANSLQAQIATASAGLGNTAAKNMYQAGVDAAQGLVNGLLAKTKALDAASKKLAAAIVAQIKKTLGIRSPSKVLEWHGSMAAIGFSRGIEGEYGRVKKAGVGLGAAAIPGSGSRRSAVPAQGGGVMRIEIAAGDSSPYTDFLVRELRKYVKIKGGNVQQAFG
jgi:hypothetical protein